MRSIRLSLFCALALVACGDDEPGAEPGADATADLSDVGPGPGDDASASLDAGSDATPDDGGAPAYPDLSGVELPLETLSAYGFFVGELAAQEPAPGVFAYAPASPLWADHADKGRFVYVPEGERIRIDEGEDWEFPEGTIVIKTFYFDLDRSDTQSGEARVVETRLMVREGGVWVNHTYVWNDEQTDAERIIAGTRRYFTVTDADGSEVEQEYLVPSTNDCNSCHERDDEMRMLGLVTFQMDYEREGQNQLDALAEAGLLELPADWDDRSYAPIPDPTDAEVPLDRRARAYLHANCAHCHRPGGGGGRSGLSLYYYEDNPADYGVCKSPVAAGSGAGGRFVDIYPGRPEASILPFRMETPDPEIRMPELPSRLIDDFGVSLVKEWIAAMDGPDCEE